MSWWCVRGRSLWRFGLLAFLILAAIATTTHVTPAFSATSKASSSCPHGCYGNTYCSTATGACVDTYFVDIQPKKPVVHLGEEKILLVRVDDPIGSDGVYDLRFTSDSSGRFFAHFSDGSTSKRLFIPKNSHVLAQVHFLPSAVGSYELKMEAAHSVYSQPPASGGICNVQGYDSTSEIWVVEEEAGESKSGWEKISAFRMAVLGGGIVMVLGLSVFVLFFHRKNSALR